MRQAKVLLQNALTATKRHNKNWIEGLIPSIHYQGFKDSVVEIR